MLENVVILDKHEQFCNFVAQDILMLAFIVAVKIMQFLRFSHQINGLYFSMLFVNNKLVYFKTISDFPFVSSFVMYFTDLLNDVIET